MEFLQKLIDYVQMESGIPVNAKPAKIVAGLDPDDTNIFLQVFVQAAINFRSKPKSPQKKA